MPAALEFGRIVVLLAVATLARTEHRVFPRFLAAVAILVHDAGLLVLGGAGAKAKEVPKARARVGATASAGALGKHWRR